MHPLRSALLGVCLVSTLAAWGWAQCPDGSPEPCGRPVRAPVRAAVPMDPKTWIVLPFENQARTAELDWLKDASVELLYLDLSRWSDVRAVDAKRVTDFLREVPSAKGGQKLSLSDAQGVARRAGAGKLVMGGFLYLGGRTRVTAIAYDTRTGTQIRVVREDAPGMSDSLLPLIGKVASGLLAVPPPAGASVGAVGTSRADALQEYLAGVAALNRFDIEEAKRRLTQALKLDPGFALAHYKLAITSPYDEAAQNERMLTQAQSGNLTALAGVRDSGRIAHAEAAARLAGTLPARERGLINGLLAHIREDYARACDLFGALVRADSSDVEALYGFGECSFKDNAIEFVAGDSARPRFRGDWNASLRALRRAITVDPGYHLAFDHVLDILTASARIGCVRKDPALPCEKAAPSYRAGVRSVGDSLLIVPVRVQYSVAALGNLGDATRSSTRRQNLEQARKAAEEWVAAGPGEGRAHRTLGRILLRLARFDEADREMAAAAALLPHDDFSDIPMYRLEIALKRGRGVEVVRLYDSLMVAAKVEFYRVTLAMMLAPVVGRLASADSVWPALLRLQAKGQPASMPPAFLRYFAEAGRIALGLGGDSTLSVERQLLAMLRAEKVCNDSCRLLMAPSWWFGLQLKRASFPTFDSAAVAADRRLAPAAAIGAGDTTRLRAAARMLDSATAAEARLGLPEDGSTLIAADAFLVLGDSAAALRAVTRMTDITLPITSAETPLGGIGQIWAGTLWPRVILLRADLEAAKGDKTVAREWYRRFLELWAKADPEFQPLLDRVRRAYVAVGGSP